MAQPLTITIAPGVDTSVPTGIQTSAKYTLTGPDGTRCVFNDQTDRDYVGALTDVTGLDSPDVRESADDLVQMDGGVHGDFFYGRRPMTMSGLILNPLSVDDRNRKMTKLQRASNAMRGDATLTWPTADGHEQFVKVRRQQPLRIQGGWQKEFQLALVAADPRIYNTTLGSTQISATGGSGTVGRAYDRGYDVDYGAGVIAGQAFITNLGNALTFPLLTVYGPGVNPILTNFTTGESISLTYSIGVAEWLTIDTLNRTVMLNDASSRYGSVNFLTTDWWGLVPDVNDIRLAFGGSFSSPASLTVQWRDAWL